MAKQSNASIQQFAITLQSVVEETEQTGQNVAPFFEKLDDALQANELANMDKAAFQEIVAEFNEATEVYEANVTRLASVTAPIKMMGMYVNLKKHYANYAAACRQMTNSLNVDDQSVDLAAFNASGDIQEAEMDKISVSIQKMMAQSQF
ncbi:hypothetical protein [Periweissella ghanensis]|uniref:Chemotaxis protein n=1 Tax=Periweissella ghanensis TaxID=467997 RepID=A0ABM8ZA84_9LACO|nr:hypothetical protein [Periweissella ghanensis]MCM0600524.1 hypothetical protein [Periweissella ghanensis]CAH0418266.1 hypothetical protein WGH24286_00684 [Periweissella ghanensis]